MSGNKNSIQFERCTMSRLVETLNSRPVPQSSNSGAADRITKASKL